MKRKTIVALLSVLVFSLIGVGMLGAQRERTRSTPKVKTMSFWNTDDGHARLGVRLADVDSEKVGKLKLTGEYGALVTDVEKDSAAAKAGLAANDVILEFDGERVRSVAELRRLVRDTPPGRTVAMKISRAGATRTLNVKLEHASSGQESPDALIPSSDLESSDVLIPSFEVPEIHAPEFNFEYFNDGPRLGISADELTAQLAEYFGVTQGKGVLVREVTPGSAAEKAGLKAADCIVRVGSEKVESVSNLHDALGGGSDEKRQVSLTIVRNRHEQTLTVELEPVRHMMFPPRRVTANGVLGIDPSELIRLKAQLQASTDALQGARRALENERPNLTKERQRLLNELSHELDRKKLENSNWVVD